MTTLLPAPCLDLLLLFFIFFALPPLSPSADCVSFAPTLVLKQAAERLAPGQSVIVGSGNRFASVFNYFPQGSNGKGRPVPSPFSPPLRTVNVDIPRRGRNGTEPLPSVTSKCFEATRLEMGRGFSEKNLHHFHHHGF